MTSLLHNVCDMLQWIVNHDVKYFLKDCIKALKYINSHYTPFKINELAKEMEISNHLIDSN